MKNKIVILIGTIIILFSSCNWITGEPEGEYFLNSSELLSESYVRIKDLQGNFLTEAKIHFQHNCSHLAPITYIDSSIITDSDYTMEVCIKLKDGCLYRKKKIYTDSFYISLLSTKDKNNIKHNERKDDILFCSKNNGYSIWAQEFSDTQEIFAYVFLCKDENYDNVFWSTPFEIILKNSISND
ncbi:MAG: hypothetical protein IKX23_07745 [Treponema sp.]|nr:hypothetical protein [Treponema sp.]